ncbi:MAG: adaptor protein MecA [Lachnospiraceae bacterium]|nr:adaptor protein MecA [Lachnospiraceae bacterium]
MKIEKINENQIRCTLNPQDLKERQLKLSEFAYGSGKAKELFHDMMEKASEECDFEVDNAPLMIEAIPTSAESLLLIITKVDNPDELDTLFSTFTPYKKEEDSDEEDTEADAFKTELNLLDNSMLDLIRRRMEEVTGRKSAQPESEKPKVVLAVAKAFCFRSFENLVAFARSVHGFYTGEAVLYRIDKDRAYLLCFFLEGTSAKDFNRVCNIACEYAEMLPKANLSFYKEHYSCLMTKDVIAQLAEF